jgi:hypothetical protein
VHFAWLLIRARELCEERLAQGTTKDISLKTSQSEWMMTSRMKQMSDDLCYFEFLHAEAVKASRRICMRVQRGHTREEGEATTYKCDVY